MDSMSHTGLARYASDPAASRGRCHPERPQADALRRPAPEQASQLGSGAALTHQPPVPFRNAFQRDRDRIVHCTAFRRLVYKTQVFVNHEGDLFRTRLTHSLEVAQLGRTIARTLSLNEDLVEAIALAHDLGHTPFGHAGQDALHECMQAHGGFEHNLQSLRVVDVLEARYPTFDGLNLSFEAREGILKHCSRIDAERLELGEPNGVARRFLDASQPSLEAQLIDLADQMAYNAHDIDDGVRSGLLSLDQLLELSLLRRHHDSALAEHPALGGRRLLFEIIRRMLSEQVHDVIATTFAALHLAAPMDANAARRMPRLVRFGAAMQADSLALKHLLMRALYRHPQVMRTTDAARTVVRELFDAYVARPAEMPDDFAQRQDRQRAVADYVAGMTDRFASREHQRLSGRDAFGVMASLPVLPAVPNAPV